MLNEYSHIFLVRPPPISDHFSKIDKYQLFLFSQITLVPQVINSSRPPRPLFCLIVGIFYYF